MLSTENVVPVDDGVIALFLPRVMFYAPLMINAALFRPG
jgi:hypothetical protein